MSIKAKVSTSKAPAGSLAKFDPAHIEVMGKMHGLIKEAVKKVRKEEIASVKDDRNSILTQTKEIADDMLRDVKEHIDAMSGQVLAVELDGEIRELSKPASPHLPRLLINAKLGLNSMLVGPAGCGKSIAAEQVAEAMGLKFGHICMTAGASETWLFGRQTPNGFIIGSFADTYKNGGVFLADEMDAADPNLMLSINTAIANGFMYNPISGEQVTRHEDFVFLGAANTVGKGGDFVYAGRNRLDAATLDRFVVIFVDYSHEIEAQVCPDEDLRTRLQKARSMLRTLNSQEIISTRALEKAYLQTQAGITLRDVFKSLTAGWPNEIIEECQLNLPEDPGAAAAGGTTPKRTYYAPEEPCTCAHKFVEHIRGITGPCTETDCTCKSFFPQSETAALATT